MRGGKREGAGRRKGSKNKTSAQREEATKAMAVALEGALPNCFKGDSHALLMAVYKNEDLPLMIRVDAARAAIGYEKPKLAAVEHSGDKDNPLAFAVLSGVPSVTDADDDDQRPAAPSH